MLQFYNNHLKERFPGVKNKCILAHLVNKEMLYLHWKYEAIEKLRLKASQLKASDYGVVFGVMILDLEVELTNFTSAMVAKLSELCGIEATAINCAGPSDFTAIKLQPLIERNQTKRLLSRLSKMHIKGCTQYTTTKPEHKHMIRIHKMVLDNTRINIREFDYGLEKEPEKLTWLLIHRLLPCFVASYVDLTNDDRVSAEGKDFYNQFITNLIDSLSMQLQEVDEFKREAAEVAISYLQWKFDCVASELKAHLYGNIEPATVTRQLQEKCFNVLTDCLGRMDETESGSLYEQWKDMLEDFSVHLHRALVRLTKLPLGFSGLVVGIEDYTLSTLCRMLAAGVFHEHGVLDKLEFSDSRVLLGSVFTAYAKTECPSIASKYSNWSAVQSKVQKESEQLSEQQRLGLVLYLCLSSNIFTSWGSNSLWLQTALLNGVELEPLGMLYCQIWCGKFETAAEKIPIFLNRKLSQVSLQFAKDTAPTCYSPVLDRVLDGKVKMDAPGQNTFCPVPHCRWCGLVKKPSEMLVCQFCTDKPKYPDTHLFCSPQCEDLAMKDRHGERHAEFLEYVLDLKKVDSRVNGPFSSPNCIMFKK